MNFRSRKLSATPSPVTPSTPNLNPRNPKVHRQSGIPSILRPVASLGVPPISSSLNGSPSIHTRGKLSLKKSAIRLLSKNQDCSTDSIPSSDRRAATMPQPLPSALQAQIDIDNDRLARGLASGSPPIVDFTHFEDTYRGPVDGIIPSAGTGKSGLRSVSTGDRPPKKTSVPSLGMTRTLTTVLDPLPAHSRKPDPRLVLSSLQDILGPSQQVEDHLDMHQLLGLHQLDQLDFEERDAFRMNFAKFGKDKLQGCKEPLAVLGEPIRKASIHSSTTMVLSGREHELPILVVNCVEELYRTGIYQSNLFRTLPNRARLIVLINIYDSEDQPPGSVIRTRQPHLGKTNVPDSGFGAATSLHLESTPDVCALLVTYLSSLPEPILTPNLFAPLWEWCGIQDDESGIDLSPPSDSHYFTRRLSAIPLARTYTNPIESTHILIAQLLLHLLPSPNFSLLVYILAFFSQVTLVREENGTSVQDIARMFGARIFGSNAPKKDSISSNETLTNTGRSEVRDRGESMMCWFLRRWTPLSEGLFDVLDDAKMGLFRRTIARRDSFGKEVLSTWLPSNQSRSDALETSGTRDRDNPAEDHKAGKSCSRDSPASSKCYLPQIYIEESPQNHSTPRKLNSKGQIRRVSPPKFDDSECNISPAPCATTLPLDDTLDIMQIPSCLSTPSVYSIPSLDERLMDISMPTLLNQTLPIINTPEGVVNVLVGKKSCDHGVQTEPSLFKHGRGWTHTSPLILDLEYELDEHLKAIKFTQEDVERYKRESSKLSKRVLELEAELAAYRHRELDKVFQERLETTIKERDDARGLVSEIKKLMG